MQDRILIFIPAYNCEKQIPRVLSKIDSTVQSYIEEVVIVDNRSGDQTVRAAINAAADLKVKVTILKNLDNYSLGGSIKRAFLYALEHGYDYMITLHGDDQADIRDLLPVLKSKEYRSHELLIGARFHKQSKLMGYSKIRILGNRALNMVCGAINARQVDDLIAGLNMFNLSFFKTKFFLTFPDNLTFDAHVLLYAFDAKARVKYLPITWREEDQVSNAKVVRQALVILRLLMSYAVRGKDVFAKDKSLRGKDFTYQSEVVHAQNPMSQIAPQF